MTSDIDKHNHFGDIFHHYPWGKKDEITVYESIALLLQETVSNTYNVIIPYKFTAPVPIPCSLLFCLCLVFTAHIDPNGLSPRQIKSDSDDDDLPNVTLDSVNETGSTALSIARAVQE